MRSKDDLPKMYCLSPKQVPWRRERAHARFNEQGLPVEFFDCVHGATAGITPTLAHFDSPGHTIGPGRMSIAISKLLIFSVLLERPEESVLIFEDDAVPVPNFWDHLTISMHALPSDWQVAHVGYCCTEDKPVRNINARVAELHYPMCCHAVLWTKPALRVARQALLNTSFGSHSDCILAKLVYPHLRHYCFTPPLAYQEVGDSEAAHTALSRWDQIQGWFDFERLYNDQLDRVVCPANFVEVGSWKGRSTAYMAEEIKRRMLPVTFWAVDTWQGTPGEPAMMPDIAQAGGDLFPTFLRNMSRAGVIDFVRPLQMDSVEAASEFPPNVDFCFIDGDHSFDGVVRDIRAWRPKLRPGRGVMAGHDIDQPQVRRAVEQEFGSRFRVWERCWVVDP